MFLLTHVWLVLSVGVLAASLPNTLSPTSTPTSTPLPAPSPTLLPTATIHSSPHSSSNSENSMGKGDDDSDEQSDDDDDHYEEYDENETYGDYNDIYEDSYSYDENDYVGNDYDGLYDDDDDDDDDKRSSEDDHGDYSNYGDDDGVYSFYEDDDNETNAYSDDAYGKHGYLASHEDDSGDYDGYVDTYWEEDDEYDDEEYEDGDDDASSEKENDADGEKGRDDMFEIAKLIRDENGRDGGMVYMFLEDDNGTIPASQLVSLSIGGDDGGENDSSGENSFEDGEEKITDDGDKKDKTIEESEKYVEQSKEKKSTDINDSERNDENNSTENDNLPLSNKNYTKTDGSKENVNGRESSSEVDTEKTSKEGNYDSDNSRKEIGRTEEESYKNATEDSSDEDWFFASPPTGSDQHVPFVVSDEGYVPRQETVIVLSDEQLLKLDGQTEAWHDAPKEIIPLDPEASDNNKKSDKYTKDNDKENNYAMLGPATTLWPTTTYGNVNTTLLADDPQASTEITSEEVRQLLQQYDALVESGGFEEEWDAGEEIRNAKDAAGRSLLQKMDLEPPSSSFSQMSTTLPVSHSHPGIESPISHTPPISDSQTFHTPHLSETPIPHTPPSSDSSIASFSSTPVPFTFHSPSTTDPSILHSLSTSGSATSFSPSIIDLSISHPSSTPVPSTSYAPSTSNPSISHSSPTPSLPTSLATPSPDLPNTPDPDLTSAYESILSSPLVLGSEKAAVDRLERLRRAVDRLGGLETLKKSPARHHIVRRQLKGNEACGVFSRRRRRDVEERKDQHEGSREYGLIDQFPEISTKGEMLESKTRNVEGESMTVVDAGGLDGASRMKRGVYNVGRRLEQGNAGYRQLFNQYKKMCEFIAMAVFEK